MPDRVMNTTPIHCSAGSWYAAKLLALGLKPPAASVPKAWASASNGPMPASR